MSADWFQVAHEVMQTTATIVLAATILRLQNQVRGIESPAKGEK